MGRQQHVKCAVVPLTNLVAEPETLPAALTAEIRRETR